MARPRDTDTPCWVLTDGTIGMRVQCLGLAAAAGLIPVVKRIHPNPLLRALPSAGLLAGVAPSSGGDPLRPPWPGIVISCGRRTAGAALAVRRLARGGLAGGGPFLAHIQDPRIAPSRFDLLVVPEHDPARGPNVVTTLGALSPHNAAMLEAAAWPWRARVEALPHPRIAVNVGGSNKRYRFAADRVVEFVERLVALSRSSGGSLLVATSRRSDAATKRALAEGLAGLPAIVWTGEGENPYPAFLHFADALIVTSDSVNMVSEACATGKPVHVAALEEETGRLADFHRRLRARGCTRAFQGRLERWDYEKLAETERVGAVLAEKLAARRAERLAAPG